MDKIENIRKEIDSVDQELVKLFEKRMNLVLEIKKYKSENSLPILDKKREELVVEKAKKILKCPYYKQYIEEFFIKIMEISKKLQCNNE